MLNNEVLRRLRTAFQFRNRDVQDIFQAANLKISDEQVRQLLHKEHEDDFAECSNEQLSAFLDGLIIHLRGPREAKDGVEPSPPVLASDNNGILRKLRIALNLRDDGMLALLKLGGFTMSKAELSALFRKAGNRHYRECGDQVLRYFLAGLTRERRPELMSEESDSDDR